ncbi:MAG: NAD(P)H-dependent oxidoreductase [Magnetococcales bacterium]|nr:NAD(P)H-dependent oxidoreductase [Magnetococcales bacterium]
MSEPKILLNIFHPNIAESRGNKVLVDTVRSLPNLKIRDLYAEYSGWQIDVKKEQELLLNHDVIIFQHPFYWYSCPALMKEWLDRVFEQGFAYPPGVGDKLKGKCWLSVVTTGGSSDAYRSGGFNNWTMSELLRPFQQTAFLSGMRWLPPFVVHGILPPGIEGYRNISEDELAENGKNLRSHLADLV